MALVSVSTDIVATRPRLIIWYVVDDNDDSERQMIWTSVSPLAWRRWQETFSKRHPKQ